MQEKNETALAKQQKELSEIMELVSGKALEQQQARRSISRLEREMEELSEKHQQTQ